MSVCLPLQQKVMSRGGLGDFLHIQGILTSTMGCVFSTGCVLHRLLCAVIPRAPHFPFIRRGCRKIWGDRAVHSGSLCCNLSHPAQRRRGGREKGKRWWRDQRSGKLSAALCSSLSLPPLEPCPRTLESLYRPVCSLAQWRTNNLVIKETQKISRSCQSPHLMHQATCWVPADAEILQVWFWGL